MPSFASLGKFFGRTASEGAAFAAGIAVAPALAPVIREIENEANSKYASHPLSAGEAAAIVAEDVKTYPFGAAEAANNGLNETRFRALLGEVLNAPGIGSLFEAYRRGLIDDAAFTHGLRKAKLETMWDAPLKALKQQLLDPAQLAVMLQRSVVRNDGILPNQPDTAGSNVPPMPQVDIDPVAEAAGSGIDRERFAAMARIIGLPASPDLAARMHFRSIITEGAFNQAILEGNTRGEWAPFLLEGFRQILTAHDWVELHLRGYITQDEMYAGTGLHGMSHEDSDRLFRVLGRPLTVHQITTALARGAKFNPLPGEIADPYEASVHEANIKPSYYELAIANKYSYPSLFQLNNLVKASAITADQAADWATKNGLAPEVVAAMLVFWKGEQGGTTTGPTRSATTRAVTAVSKAYIATRSSRATAEAELTKLGVDPATFNGLFNAWDVNREATIAAMTNTQIRNAFRNLTITETDALARLEARGLSAADATAYLTAKPGT
jgi:hypothetical protein